VAIDLSPLDKRRFETGQLLGRRQVTGTWLLGLVVEHKLRFVSFDTAAPMRVARQADTSHLVLL
jgi:hypothetical protein